MDIRGFWRREAHIHVHGRSFQNAERRYDEQVTLKIADIL
jgi:hypothetical protein